MRLGRDKKAVLKVIVSVLLKGMGGQKSKLLSPVQLFVTPWAIQSMEFSKPEYWSG